MRTANEIKDSINEEPYVYWPDVITIINIAREETIRECDEAAKSEWVRWGEHMGHQVYKQSILKLIQTLK